MHRSTYWSAALGIMLVTTHAAGQEGSATGPRPRARDLGIAPGIYTPDPLNAITDVGGVAVGHVTLVEGNSIRTGVTAILPHGGNVFQSKVPAGVYIANAFGKMAGTTQVQELGNLETPIVLTNTLSVGVGVQGVVQYILELPGNEEVRSVNAVVGETNDGGLNDIRRRSVTTSHVLEAIRSAATGPVAEGAVGAGTGTQCLGYKGGIGTASRRLPDRQGGFVLGVLVQSNYGGVLEIDGVPVAKEWGRSAGRSAAEESGDGSVIIVVATDAPLSSRNLARVAKRAVLGLAKTGSAMSNGSGDYVIAFSTAEGLRIPYDSGQRRVGGPELANDALSPLFQAVKEATEEAVYNSLLQARTVEGFRGRRAEALPVDRLTELLRKYRPR